uniref:Transposase Tnp1/En/Spm-like domain-containing protein n=1 Tax=Oryza glaberrima TaxID=4538 RepID=I1PJB6_ORYGL
MDKQWMDKPRHSREYSEGLDIFLQHAFSSAVGNKIQCPCKKCASSFWRDESEVHEHLICEGFLRGYKPLMFHGEGSSFVNSAEYDEVGDVESSEHDDISDLLRDLACGLDDRGEFEDEGNSDVTNEDLNALKMLSDDYGQELYPGCDKFSKLHFIVKLLHIKLLGGWSDKSFDLLLNLLIEAFPKGSALPKNYNEAKKTVKCLGLGYVSIHAYYPGLGYVAGCTTSGEGACIECHQFTRSLRLKKGSKTCYMGHRRFLHANHPFRFDADSFDGVVELESSPVPLSGKEILKQTEGMQTSFGKDPSGKKVTKKRKCKEGEPINIWKRRSIWFKLPYWKDLLLRHNLDVMHIEKNVCDNIINTLLGTDKKSKDNLNSRLDLQALGIRSDLHPIEVEDKFYLPPAPYSMTSEEKKLFCKVLNGVKFPDGYASDIRRNVQVNEKKIIGLKSHDNHVILQQLLPLAVRRILPENVSAALVRVSNFFKQIYSPVIRAHRYVLFNYDNIDPYLNKHIDYLSSTGLQNKHEIDRVHHETFHEWFRLHVTEMGDDEPEEIKILAKEPIMAANKYNSYTINGFNFHTQSYDEGRPVQSSGVSLMAETTCFERGNNDCRVVGNKIYYGIIKEIIELNYSNRGNIVLFKCDWVDNRIQDKWVRTDQFGITTVNFKHLFNTGDNISDEPFILASQAIQVYYVQDPVDTEWFAVRQSKPRDLYNMSETEKDDLGNDTEVSIILPDVHPNSTMNISVEETVFVRTDIDGIIVEANKPKTKNNGKGKRKVTDGRNMVPRGDHNLRSRSRNNLEENVDENVGDDPEYQPEEDAMDDNEVDVEETLELEQVQQKKKEGRGITQKLNIISRVGEAKIKITLNEFGQPVGLDSEEFATTVGTFVRKKIPVACGDWRDVDIKDKLKVWEDVQKHYEINEYGLHFVLETSHMIWKDYKADLKKKHFDANLTDEELMDRRDLRVNEAQWKWLINHWRSPEAVARSIRGKANRGMLRMLHSAGCKSHARVGHDMGVKTGRPPRRDEVFVETHKRKNGEIIPEAAETVEMLKEAAEVNPELKNKTIQEGDLYSRVCGTKEPRGRVRVLGKGPTPQDVGTPGTRSRMPTRLQLEIESHRQTKQEVVCLNKRMDDMQQRFNIMEHMVMSQGVQNIETSSHHASNSRHAEVGKDVILYAVLRSDTPVAKATIVSIDPSSLVGGQPLGVEFYEVVVNVVLKRDALLPRPYDDMQTMADAQYTSIAWPNNRLNVSKRSAMSKSANSKSAEYLDCLLVITLTC